MSTTHDFFILQDGKPVDVRPPALIEHFVHMTKRRYDRAQRREELASVLDQYSVLSADANNIIRNMMGDRNLEASGEDGDKADLEFKESYLCGGREPFCRIRNHLEFISLTFFHHLKHDDDNWSKITVERFQTEISPSFKIKIKVLDVRSDADGGSQPTFEGLPPHRNKERLIEKLKRSFDLNETAPEGDAERHVDRPPGDILDRLSGSALASSDKALRGGPGAVGEETIDAYVWTDAWGPSCRMLVVNVDREPERLGRLVRRLLDIVTYTVIGAEGRRKARNQLDTMKDTLKKLNEIMISAQNEQVKPSALFTEIVEQAAKVSGVVAENRAYFTRSIAYWRIVEQRLAELNEQPISGFARLGSVVRRNFKPVRDNCAMAIQCQTGMAKQIEQASAILRTKAELITQQKSRAIDLTAKTVSSALAAIAVPKLLWESQILVSSDPAVLLATAAGSAIAAGSVLHLAPRFVDGARSFLRWLFGKRRSGGAPRIAVGAELPPKRLTPRAPDASGAALP